MVPIRTFLLLLAFCGFALLSHTLSARSTYLEENGLVVVETENVDDLNGWEIDNILTAFVAPGTCEIEVDARSTFHANDRRVMYHSYVAGNTARALSNPEPARENVVSGIVEITGELRTWHDVQLTFDGPATSEDANPNPFSDYRFDVTFTSGEATFVVPGYYAADGNAAETSATSGNKWRVHFAPNTTGTWTWTVAFKTGTDIAVADDNTGGVSAGFMDGDTGTFNVTATDKTGRDHRGKGRLQYVGEHYLRYAGTNEWFVKAGSDAPENTLAYDDFDEVPNANGLRKSWQPHQQDFVAADAEAYTWQNGKGSELLGVVNYLSGKGVNAFSFLTFNTEGDDKNVFPHLLINDLPNNTNAVGWGGLHHDRFDVSRTAQWERIFSYADVKGMYMHFKTQETENNNLMDGGNVGRERKLYYRELIARFGHHLALNWNMGEENTQTTQQRKDMAAYFADTDPYNHLRVIHTYPGEISQYYTPLLGTASQYTGLSIQTSGDQQTQNFEVTKTWVENSNNAQKKWVVAIDEPGSANTGVDSDPRDRKLTRHRVVWANFMAGGAGTEFYYGYGSGCGDLDCQDHRTRDEKYTDAAFALNFFQTYFQQYLPNVVNADGLTTTTADWVLNANNQAFAVYLPNGGSTGISLPTNVGIDWQVRWYNPRDGSISTPININTTITAPDGDDWVALIEAGNCTENTACDDGDACTTNDLLDADCNCQGTFADADNDTVCDAEDLCPGENDLADADNDDLPDACDDCDNTTTGTACDDGNPNTINDAIDINCNCTGQPLPDENDYWLEAECAVYGSGWEELTSASAVNGLYLQPVGAVNFIDGPPTEPAYLVSFDVTITTPGNYKVFALVRTTSGNDDSFWVRANGSNDWVKWNKIGFDYGYNGFIWAEMGQWNTGDDTTPVTFDLTAGTNVIDFAVREPGIQFDRVFITLDGDMPNGEGAMASNCEAGECAEGAACNDGNECTINDLLDADCNCQGTFADADGDTVCDAQDQCPGGNDLADADNDDLPDACDDCDNTTTAGAACDDGNGCTTNDILDADCNCQGTFADADGDTVCDAEDLCPGENDLADADNDDLPDACDDCDNTTTGTACDDGNPNTINDAIDINCNCTGQPFSDENDFWLEAECAVYGSGWEELTSASAVNGLYLQPVGAVNFIDGPPTEPAYLVSFDVTITTPGNYKVIALVRTTNDSDDSFWVRANGSSNWVKWNKIGFDYGYNGFIWAEMGQWNTGDDTTPVTFDLTAGTNVIDFAVREPGIQFDRVFITLDGDMPTGDGVAATNCDNNESCGAAAQPPFQILHFTKTSGFNHQTKSASLQMFKEIGAGRNFTVVNSDDESAFNDLNTLMNYEVIVFANTSGNIPFTAVQKANLESYVASGGGILGIHAATDMYRDASYTFYTQLMGGSRRNSPAHTSNNFPGTTNKVGSHPSTMNVPDPWSMQEEYYYWPDTGLVDDIVVVLEVESTGSNSYDASRPASWYQVFDSGARSFYTTLGHKIVNYTDPDNEFRQHLADALCWLVEAGTTALPLNVIGAGLENDAGLHTIDWRVSGDIPVRVELYGGYDQAAATLLTAASPDAFDGVLRHQPNNEMDWFYYRLRFVSEEGLATWSEWLSAAPFKDNAGGGAQVQYAAEGAVLVVPAGGPAQAIVSDASGRIIGGLQLTEGQNLLPKGPAGVYVIRFPFRTKALRYVVR